MEFQSKIKNRMANSVDSDETARYNPSQLDLHPSQLDLYRLHRHWYWSAGLKGLRSVCPRIVLFD